MSDIYDLAILGGGPAGITAAIYASSWSWANSCVNRGARIKISGSSMDGSNSILTFIRLLSCPFDGSIITTDLHKTRSFR